MGGLVPSSDTASGSKFPSRSRVAESREGARACERPRSPPFGALLFGAGHSAKDKGLIRSEPLNKNSYGTAAPRANKIRTKEVL